MGLTGRKESCAEAVGREHAKNKFFKTEVKSMWSIAKAK